MTDAEKLYSEHEHLTTYVINRFYPTFAADQDFRQEARIALWYACQNFKAESDAKFSTYAITTIRWGLKNYMRTYKLCTKNPAEPNVHIDSVDYETATWMINDWGKFSEDFEYIDFKSFMQALTDRQQEIVNSRLKGETVKNIADHYGLSRVAIYDELKKIHNVFDKFI